MSQEMEKTTAVAIARLGEYARRSEAQEEKVPATLVKEEDWQGLAFVLDGTRVPGTRNWMLGLANIRGELLPIVDLQQFMGSAPVPLNERCRVLVIRNRGASTGLLVSSVLGMRHLPLEKQIADADFEGVLGQYVYDVFALEDGVWPVFSMAALANDERFLSAAA